MSRESFDAITVGCGLAGAALAWHFHWLGQRLLVIDSNLPNSASRAAAGVMSAHSGERHTKTWRWEDFWPVAQEFYRRVALETGLTLFHEIDQLRFISAELAASLASKEIPVTKCTSYASERFYAALKEKHRQAFVVQHGSGILDVTAYLNATAKMLQKNHRFVTSPMDYDAIELNADHVHLRHENISAKALIFCEGWRGQTNPWFDDLEFESVRGESLVVKCESLPQSFIYHGEISVVPIGRAFFRIGSTYDREDLISGPSNDGKNYLLAQFDDLFDVSFDVIDHSAGVRPVIRGRKPVIKQHPQIPQCWYFNGLASRGCLQAPKLADTLAATIIAQQQSRDKIITPSVEPSLKIFSTCEHTARLTTVAHQLVQQHIQAGDDVIDATAGNGNDTLLLARCTTRSGCVYAFDIQDLALQRTRERLAMHGYEHVVLIKSDHRHMASLIPAEALGKISTVMFNLGYLPGGDTDISTKSENTKVALSGALKLLKERGLCSILCYRGHPGGNEETLAVISLLRSLDKNCFDVTQHLAANSAADSPALFIIRKLRDG
ncbi:MAG: FAD-dependent oxidoreductase [Gammaproteobacteria bacterium]